MEIQTKEGIHSLIKISSKQPTVVKELKSVQKLSLPPTLSSLTFLLSMHESMWVIISSRRFFIVHGTLVNADLSKRIGPEFTHN